MSTSAPMSSAIDSASARGDSAPAPTPNGEAGESSSQGEALPLVRMPLVPAFCVRPKADWVTDARWPWSSGLDAALRSSALIIFSVFSRAACYAQ